MGFINKTNIYSYLGDHYIFSNDSAPDTRTLGPKYFYRRHVDVLKKMEMTDTRHDLYSWKHTWAIALWNATHYIELVRSQCRHKIIQLTIQYLRDLGADLTQIENIHKLPKF